ncbi:MAG: hypothetical protein U0M91_01810 [Lachnospira eligens]
MDLTPEFAQHVIDSASKYKECTLEVDRLTSLLQEARLKQKAAESEFRKCLTIEIDCSKAIDTSIGKIPIIGKGEAKSINQRVDSLLDEVFSKDETFSKEEFLCKDGGIIVVSEDEVYYLKGKVKTPLEKFRPADHLDLSVSLFSSAFTNRKVRIIKFDGKVFYGEDYKPIGYSILHPYLELLKKNKDRIYNADALHNALALYDASNGKLTMKELAAADILAGGNGAAIRIIAKLAEAVKLLETMTIYYL